MRSIILVISALLSIPSFASAPDFEWKVLKTKHFEILYHKPQRELAKHYAYAAEESHRILSPVFSDLPQKTVLVLDDSTDLTNGSATFLPYDWVTIYPSLPAPGESLDDYGYWPTSIMVHEYTHIANFQPVGGFYTPLLYLMGRIVTPNTLLPRWYLEGLAVDSESRYTGFGRLRSSRTQGILRSLALGDRFKKFRIDQINESAIPTWPFGERPYFFGSLLQKSLVDRGTPDLRERWNQRYGRRVPFLIDAVPRDDFDRNYSSLLNETYDAYQAKAQSQLQKIAGDGEFKPLSFQPVEHEQFEPSISKDGLKLAYISRSYRRSSLWLIEKSSPLDSFSSSKPKLLFHVSAPLKVVWDENDQGLYFDEADMDTPYKSYRHVYHYDLSTKKKTLVTPKNIRAQEPSLLSNGAALAFITTDEQTRRQVAVMDLRSKEIKTVYTAPLQERVSSPVFNGESTVLFVQKNLQGEDQLKEVLFPEGEVYNHALPLKNLRSLHRGKERIYFVSNHNGVDNIYSVDLKLQNLTAHSNTLTWIQDSTTWESEGTSYPFVFSQMTPNGLRLFESPRGAKYTLTEKPPLVHYENRPAEKPPTPDEMDAVVESEGSFYPFKYLVPRYWIPFVYPVDGGVLVQGSTSAMDPVGVNQYLLSGSYDSVTDKSSYGFAYLNNSFPVAIGGFAARYQEYLSASGFQIEKTNHGGTLSAPLGFLSQRWVADAGYSKSSAKGSTTTSHREGPEVGLSFSNLLDRRYSENGSLFSASYQKYLEGREHVAYDQVSVNVGQKISSVFKEDHSLWMNLKGSFANQLPANQTIRFGERSLGANYLVNLTESQYLYRGYPSGSLIGRQLLNSNIEYRFPMSEMYHGSGSAAYFFKSLTGVAFVDAMAVDGYYFDFRESVDAYIPTEISEVHMSAGGELRLDTTLAYHLPLTFIVGGYYGLSQQMGENFSLFIGIGGQDPLSETTGRLKSMGK